jgi:hypothetical protein
VIFRRVDAVTREHDGRIDVDGLGSSLVADDVVGAARQIGRRAVRGNQGGRGAVQRLCAGEIDALQITAVVAGGLQAIERELRGDIAGGDIAAACAGAAPLQQIVRQELNVGANPVGTDSRHRRRDLRRKSQPSRGIGRRPGTRRQSGRHPDGRHDRSPTHVLTPK